MSLISMIKWFGLCRVFNCMLAYLKKDICLDYNGQMHFEYKLRRVK